MKKLVITNVAYGPVYTNIFLNLHLKSLLDPTNIPALKERIEGYTIFTDEESEPFILAHPNLKALAALTSVKTKTFQWPPDTGDSKKFGSRYTLLKEFFRQSVTEALEKDTYLSAITADYVFAKDFLPKTLSKMDQGHGAVFVMPMRAAFESTNGILNVAEGALDADRLFQLAYCNMHPLWVACHWGSPQFSKIPFSLIWNSGTGLLVHSFAITPVIFQPTEKMKYAKEVIDVEVPSLCKNPFWASDWVDAPCICVEPLFCYYPPFSNKRSDTNIVGSWARNNLHPSQLDLVKVPLFYPDKKRAGIHQAVRESAKANLSEILVTAKVM